MEQLQQMWKEAVKQAFIDLVDKQKDDHSTAQKNILIEEQFNFDNLVPTIPPDPALGDIAFPLFPFSPILKASPQKIGEMLRPILQKNIDDNKELTKGLRGEIDTVKGYLNITIPTSVLAEDIISAVLEDGDSYGCSDLQNNRRIMVEFSCPNTNKPLHLGHLRNDAIGESISRILAANGAQIHKVNLINDRGIHICKSMLAYKHFGNGETPETANKKSDHFVGEYYIRYNSWSKEDPEVEKMARDMLKAWESNDSEIVDLWKKMNDWAVKGIEETYNKTGISFDKVYYESQTYTRGREEVLRGLDRGIFYTDDEGTVWVDLTDQKLDKKVLLRKDGTSLYLTQDIGTAIARHDDWPFNTLIYVVGSEQKYHFKVLFAVLKMLGFEWADSLYHLSYGMVNLPEGKMKSREGTVVDADDLINKLTTMALDEIYQKKRENEVNSPVETAKAIALAALNYYVLQVTPGKDMIFDPKESISFNGNTGPYLQYMGARICSLLRKYESRKHEYEKGAFKAELMDKERELIKLLAQYPKHVKQSGQDLNPSIIAAYLYDLSREFSRYYHENPILQSGDPNLTVSRIEVVRAVLQVLKSAYFLIGIPFLESM